MTRFAFSILSLAALTSQALAGQPVPEVDSGSGLLALAAVAGVVAIVRERMRG